MVTWHNQKPMDFTANGAPVLYGVGDCLSTDTKPTDGIYNGSTLHELDTQKVFKFDAENKKWQESPNSGSVDVASADDVKGVLNDGE